MAELSSHTPGAFCWVELATSDQKAGVAFYRDLFGWTSLDHDMGPAGVYTMFQMRGKDVAAAAALGPEEQQHGVPSHWNMYVSVDDADTTVARARELGATVLAPAFDVMDAGRMAVLQDPTGAVFNVWQPKRHAGSQIVNEPGALCWSELSTRDTKKAEAFYTALFGWTTKRGDAGGMEYTEFSVQGQPSIGMMAMPPGMPAQVPSYWMPYFQVSDCDASTASAQARGARAIVPPQDIPKTGRFSVVSDPQGATLALFTLAGA